MTKPLIGVTSADRIFFQTDYFEGIRVSYALSTITNAVIAAGGLPVNIPIHQPELAKDYINNLDGLVLSGGTDVSPQMYEETPLPKIDRIDPLRDQREIALVKAAFAKKIPVLGICRGFQLVNVILGGSLYQDLSYLEDQMIQHDQLANSNIPVHRISVDSQSHYGSFTPDQTWINSYHHQAIKDLAPDLKRVAWADDGIVEAAEVLDDRYDFMGVQYHPESLADEYPVHHALFEDFIVRAQQKHQH
ncbi:hypothetical protein AWM75_04930 [Aerococcus urinaehominis]|uniref:Uncharacterized protein n=1 Tax=Aerococcus urinaehominis TaxID=128944 RepID=A0A0X8FL92_9LACT|nr:gamma-glutamyl-gamma-aminobutyrate hydrolase family protein [Aerococcus urinaehominis]AMB99374.1 hypothetical protein AWM75_04930 [Aerococcus urinaehominis]SDM22874.1 putative glutamine amidotransferase [Aerococcus urinaehominis]